MSDEGHILAWRNLEEDSAGFIEGHGDEECRKAAAKAMSLLLQQDRTKKNLMDRLYRGGFSERASEYALQYVMHFGYVDDLRYAQNYISCHKGHRTRRSCAISCWNGACRRSLSLRHFWDTKKRRNGMR